MPITMRSDRGEDEFDGRQVRGRLARDAKPETPGSGGRCRQAAGRPRSRGSMMVAPVLLTGCEPGVLDPAGPVGIGRKDDPARLTGDHARDRGADDRWRPRLRLVVPRIEHAGEVSAGLRVFGPAGVDRLGHPAADDHAAGRRGLGRLARAGSGRAAGVEAAAAGRAGCLAGLEVAVHLPGPGYRQRSTNWWFRLGCRCISR